MESREALNEIKNYTLVTYDKNREDDDCITFGELEPNLIEAIEKDLDRLEKQDKAIEIMKAKDVDINEFIQLIKYNRVDGDEIERFNIHMFKIRKDLSEEEFDLLKEVFG